MAFITQNLQHRRFFQPLFLCLSAYGKKEKKKEFLYRFCYAQSIFKGSILHCGSDVSLQRVPVECCSLSGYIHLIISDFRHCWHVFKNLPGSHMMAQREERGSYLWAVLREHRWGKEPGNQTRGAFSSLWETFHCTPRHKTFQSMLQIWNINRNSSSSIDWCLFPHLLCTKQRINTTGNICVRPYWLI